MMRWTAPHETSGRGAIVDDESPERAVHANFGIIAEHGLLGLAKLAAIVRGESEPGDFRSLRHATPEREEHAVGGMRRC